MVSIFSMIVILLVATLCAIMFAVTSRAVVLNDGGEMSTAAALFWVIVPVALHAALLTWLCHPAAYLIFMVLLIVAEAITIGKSTSPGMRFFSWFWMALAVQAAGMIVGANSEGAWSFSGRRAILYLIPLIIFMAVGLITVVIYSDDDEEETDDKQDNLVEISPEDVENADGSPSVA